MQVRQATVDDYLALLELWQAAGLHTGPHDTPERIARKLERDPELFLVAELDGRLAGTIMGSWDGWRGWINRLAVHPDYQRRGIGTRLLGIVEDRLRAKGCRRAILHITRDNAAVQSFYGQLGYGVNDLITMGKRLPETS